MCLTNAPLILHPALQDVFTIAWKNHALVFECLLEVWVLIFCVCVSEVTQCV